VHHLTNGSTYDIDVLDGNPNETSPSSFLNYGTWTPVKGKMIEASGLAEDVDLNDMDGYFFCVVNSVSNDVEGCCEIQVEESSESTDSSEDEGDEGGDLPFIP